MTSLLSLFLLLQAATAGVPDARPTVARALPLLQTSAAKFAEKRTCISCHHSILPIFTLPLARSRGFEIDSAVLEAVKDRTFVDLRGSGALDKAVQAATINDPTPNDSYLLMAAAAAGMSPNLTTAVYARRLASWQRDGHWVTSDFRPPHSSSEFTATATAIRALHFYMPEELNALRDETILRARRWLVSQHPLSTEDAAFRLMGLVWAEASAKEIQSAVHDLLAMQVANGGWPQLRGYESDAYSTGEALYALSEAQTTASEAAEKGVRYLISTQAADGSWLVRSRMLSPATVSPPYFDSGFPYAHDEFLSYAGTSWAVMALLRTLPVKTPENRPENQLKEEGWERTALFGSAAQLRTLLDGGLNANAATANGTSLLMMSAPDAEKVRLLLSRGATVKTRSPSGMDALTVAAAYRGTAASLKVLLAAGAEADPPQGAHPRRTPLTLAAMSGDVDNVRLLLNAGADASADALSESVTFGYPDVLRVLVRAGADPTITESTGINLLHWATITNRSALIPVLAKMGVPVNDLDDNGFTPLLYAVTLDFGETRTLRALLKAGADPKVKNPQGRDAAQQAQFLKHSDMQSALK